MRISTVHELASAVRGRRQSLRLTQAQLATRAGVSRSFVVDLEAGKVTVALRPVLAVLEALGYALLIADPESPQPGSLIEREPAGGGAPFDLDSLLDDYDSGRT